MINAIAFKFNHNLNDRTKKWLDKAKTQIKAEGIGIVSNNANGDIWLKEEEKAVDPIYDEETTAKINKLLKEIEDIKASAIPINQGQTYIKKTVYVKHIEDDIVANVNQLLKPDGEFNKTILKALESVRMTKTNIH